MRKHTQPIVALSLLLLASCVGVRSSEVRGTWLDIVRAGSQIAEQNGEDVPPPIVEAFGATLALLDSAESVEAAALRGAAEPALLWYEEAVASSAALSELERRVYLDSARVFRLAIR